MNSNYHKPFSKLHHKTIMEKRLGLSLSKRLRTRIWHLLSEFNEGMGVQRDPNDRWIDNSDIMTEIIPKLHKLYGVDHLEIQNEAGKKVKVGLKDFIIGCYPNRAFDVIQLWYSDISIDRQQYFQRELNEILDEESCPWRFCDYDFFKIDSKFMEEKVLMQTQELLSEQSYHGAMQEFVEARNDFSSGDFKGTILNACKAFESVMKVILSKDGGAADDLIKGLDKAGVLDDIPQNLRRPFETKVLQTVPFMRNTLAGHGQGQQLVTVSRELAELGLHLSGALILFCIRRQLAMNPPSSSNPAYIPDELPDDDVPF
jgi:hypothetical protein